MVRVFFSAGLRSLTGGATDIQIEAGTVKRLLAELDARYPGMAERLSEGTAVAINGEIINDALYEPIPDGAEVHFLEALKGG